MSEQPKNVIRPNTIDGNNVKPKPLDSRNRLLYEFDNNANQGCKNNK